MSRRLGHTRSTVWPRLEKTNRYTAVASKHSMVTIIPRHPEYGFSSPTFHLLSGCQEITDKRMGSKRKRNLASGVSSIEPSDKCFKSTCVCTPRNICVTRVEDESRERWADYVSFSPS